MVISQIAGIATAFGIGELSGAGFGPNYTILMKLGYEFFAPRILEEMEKNPNVFFQDTLWFQKFQKQIKLYSDTVMAQTLNRLLEIPQKTIDAIEDKFGKGGTDSNIFSENLIGNVQGGFDIAKAFSEALSKLTFNFNIFPQASGSLTPDKTATTFLNQILDTGLPTQFTQPTGFVGPVQEFQTQTQIFNSTNTFSVYRQRGGLLIESKFNDAKKDLRNITIASGELDTKIHTKLVVGATSTRRRSQSSDIKLKSLLQQLVNAGNNLKRSTDERVRGIIIKQIKRLQDEIQRHQNTYK